MEIRQGLLTSVDRKKKYDQHHQKPSSSVKFAFKLIAWKQNGKVLN